MHAVIYNALQSSVTYSQLHRRECGKASSLYFSEQKRSLTERDELGMSGLDVETAEVSKSIGDTHKPTFKKRGFKGKIRSSSEPEVKVEKKKVMSISRN
jgi:hypothetical protein